MSRELQRLADLVRQDSGIDIRGGRLKSLSAALAKVAPGMSPAAALNVIAEGSAGGASLKARLIESIAVHETFFLRQRRDFDAIDWQSLRATARDAGSDRVRVWVAACATGEEAYTVALLAARAFSSVEPPIAIVATDLSAAALLRAEHGRYGRRSIRNLDADARRRFFVPDGNAMAVGPQLRALVRFRRHNLVRDKPPGAQFDLIFCRNVLIYFDAPTVEHVVRSLDDALAPGGELVLGAADRLCGPGLPRRQVTSRPRPRQHPTPGPEASRTWRSQPPPSSPAALTDEGDGIGAALEAADRGRLDEAIALADSILEADPLRADAHFVRGMSLLQQNNPGDAADALRRALYIDPNFALAAFTLARAHDARGDDVAARRGYSQTLRLLERDQEQRVALTSSIDLASVALACRAGLDPAARAAGRARA